MFLLCSGSAQLADKKSLSKHIKLNSAQGVKTKEKKETGLDMNLDSESEKVFLGNKEMKEVKECSLGPCSEHHLRHVWCFSRGVSITIDYYHILIQVCLLL